MSGWAIGISAAVSLISTAAATTVSIEGQQAQAQAQKASANYNAEVAAQNAELANKNASLAGAAGAAQVEQEELKNRSKIGGIIAQQGASGVDVNSGSSLDVQSSSRDLGELNALTVRSNAVKQAYSYQTQAAGYGAESGLQSYQASTAGTAGDIASTGTAIGGVGTAATNYAKFQSISGNGSNISTDGNPAGSYTDSSGIQWNPYGQ